MDNTEIIGISTCGTYPCWIDYTVASFYNHVDKVIIVNSGYNINNPDLPIHRLEREHSLLKKIDINNKIEEHTLTKQDIDKIYTFTCNRRIDEAGRALPMTFATKIASKLKMINNKERWILKLDSDQILYQTTKEQLINIINKNAKYTGFRFAQYMDYFHDFEHISSKSLPNNFTDDGALFYKANSNRNYVLNGIPDGHAHQIPITELKTSHMRRITPPNVDKYEHFFKRFWYHTFGPNSTNTHEKKLTNEEITKIAHESATSAVNGQGISINDVSKDERIPYVPPLVCTMSPLEYIKKGY